jgi:hypothetical protein
MTSDVRDSAPMLLRPAHVLLRPAHVLLRPAHVLLRPAHVLLRPALVVLALGLLTILLTFGLPAPANAQSRYLPADASGFGLFGRYGSHLGTTTLSGTLGFSLGSRLDLAFTAGSGRVDDDEDFYTGEDPKFTHYGPRISLHLAPPGEDQSIGLVIRGGWEWQDFTHPEIDTTGELTSEGVVLGATVYRVLQQGPTTDVYLSGSFDYYGLTARSVIGGTTREDSDPTQRLGAGVSFVLKMGRERSQRLVLNPFLDILEGDLSFGVTLGYVLPMGQGSDRPVF